jgi:hypothetical protein
MFLMRAIECWAIEHFLIEGYLSDIRANPCCIYAYVGIYSTLQVYRDKKTRERVAYVIEVVAEDFLNNEAEVVREHMKAKKEYGMIVDSPISAMKECKAELEI